MSVLTWSLISAFGVGLISLVGVITLVLKHQAIDRVIIFLVSLSAGAMMGGAFFHLLPEALDGQETLKVFINFLIGFCLFFILERILRWHHCHKEDGDCEVHGHLGWLNVIGDGLHNFIDGMIIFAGFAAGPEVGLAVLVSIILHEIPQEIGDFGVLLYSGFSRLKALAFNFISALTAVIGVLIAYFLYEKTQDAALFLMSFAAGGFVYIAASDLIPELHKEKRLTKSIFTFILFVVALVGMYFMKVWLE